MSHGTRARALVVSAWVLVLLAILLHLPYPLSGDQALFLYGAGRLTEGDRLYVEFWDNKQPGIYWFYLAARRLFGPTAAAVHGLEALWMIGLAQLSYGIVRRAGVDRSTSCLAPIAAVAAFYGAAGAWHLTQVEGLVGLPLLAVASAAVLPSETRAQRVRNAAIMGIGTGIVAIFKLVLSVVPVGMCLLYVAWLVRSWRSTVGRATLDVVVPVAVASTLVVSTGALFLAIQGGGREALWANFGYPLAAAREIHAAPFGRLVASAKWLFGAMWPFLPLALAGSILPTQPDASSERRQQVRRFMIGWIVLAAAALLVQKFSWWEYHFAVFFVPVGVLATIGFGRATTSRRRMRWAAFGCYGPQPRPAERGRHLVLHLPGQGSGVSQRVLGQWGPRIPEQRCRGA